MKMDEMSAEQLIEDLICNVAEDVNSGRDEYSPETKALGDEAMRLIRLGKQCEVEP